MSKILVTGGAGYIGSHVVVELLHAGYEPVVVDDLSRGSIELLKGVEKITRKKVIFHQVDCSNLSELSGVFQEHPEIIAVMHFAAFKSVKESVVNPLMYYRNNIDSMLTLLEVMRKQQVFRLVFSSSCTVYGQPDMIPVTEDAPFKTAESPYGATKQMCERILQDTIVVDKAFRFISLRYFNPIGAHPTGLIGELPIGIPDNLVPFIAQTAIGKRDKLVVFGADYQTPDGSCLRDFIHVVDLAIAHVSALTYIQSQENGFEAINVGTGIPCSVLELIHSFTMTTGVPVNHVIGQRRPGDIEKVYADPSKSLRVLNWKAERSIEEALRDAWNWEKKMANQ